jgi:hypothetical protein
MRQNPEIDGPFTALAHRLMYDTARAFDCRRQDARNRTPAWSLALLFRNMPSNTSDLQAPYKDNHPLHTFSHLPP